MILSPWLTAAEASAYLKIPRRTLLEWVRRGQIQAFKLSGTKRHIWRFKQEDLDSALVTTAPQTIKVLQSRTSSAVH
ncbi:MAG TPA: helix-turn-helix domain-containing protein [Terriglobales bacterium]|nr:helix-turn-helix domain-containing protein [Terriglobales bacterium]